MRIRHFRVISQQRRRVRVSLLRSQIYRGVEFLALGHSLFIGWVDPKMKAQGW